MRDNKLGAVVIDISFTIQTNGVIHLRHLRLNETKLERAEE